MLRFTPTLLFALFLSATLNAQIQHSPVQTTPIYKSVQFPNGLSSSHWNTALQTKISKPFTFSNLEAIKKANAKQNNSNTTPTQNLNKTTGATPVIGNSFRGNDLNSFTPSDNDIAISNDGIIVSVINQNIEVYAANGSQLLGFARWNDFIDYSTLNRGKFDPKVLYDPYHDRFVTLILHAPADTTNTSIIIAFSKTNDPLQGWHMYNLTGNPIMNGGWTDYASIGINEFELFLNANLFERAPNFSYLGTYIQQIDLASAYAGAPLQSKLWSGFDRTKFITIKPAPDGQLRETGNRNMRFVMLNPGQDSLVYSFNITDTMNASSLTIDSASYEIPYYSACAQGYIKDQNSGFIDSISTGSAWAMRAFTLDNNIHFTFSSNQNGDCGVNYGRINLGTQSANYTTYSEPGTNLAYPCIASIGYNEQDKNTAMVYVRSDTNILPEVCVITIDDAMIWSSAQTVKQGDTIIDILGAPGNPNGTERWGDYSGIARKYNATTPPEAWLFGAYAANTSGRFNSWANWIAQIKSADFPVSVSQTDKNSKHNASIYPNPAISNYTVSFELEKKSDVSLIIYNMNGSTVKTLYQGKLPKSRNEFVFNRNALPNGQYFIRLNVDGQQETKKLLLVE